MIDEKRGALNAMKTMALEIYHLVGAHYHSSTWLLQLLDIQNGEKNICCEVGVKTTLCYIFLNVFTLYIVICHYMSHTKEGMV